MSRGALNHSTMHSVGVQQILLNQIELNFLKKFRITKHAIEHTNLVPCFQVGDGAGAMGAGQGGWRQNRQQRGWRQSQGSARSESGRAEHFNHLKQEQDALLWIKKLWDPYKGMFLSRKKE